MVDECDDEGYSSCVAIFRTKEEAEKCKNYNIKENLNTGRDGFSVDIVKVEIKEKFIPIT